MPIAELQKRRSENETGAALANFIVLTGMTGAAATMSTSPWQTGAIITAGVFATLYTAAVGSFRQFNKVAAGMAAVCAAMLGGVCTVADVGSQNAQAYQEQKAADNAAFKALPVVAKNVPISQADLCALAPVRDGFVVLNSVKAKVACPAPPQ